VTGGALSDPLGVSGRAALAALLVLCACIPAHAPPPLVDETAKPAHTGAGDRPELSLKAYPSGAVWRLSGERGHVVLLDVWATWCDPCRDSLPLYGDLQKEFAAKGLKVYAINVDADPRGIPRFMNEIKVDLPVLLDPEATVVESTLKVKLMPTSFLVDKNGVVRHVHEGFDESLLSTYLEEIGALLEEQAP